MDRHTRMYDLEYPSPEVAVTPEHGPTLIVALQGYADAGHAVESSANHLLHALEHRPVASFHSDELIDYRSRRPLWLFEALDAIVRAAGGRLYPAKDARMPAELFQVSYPQLAQFLPYRDPGISSAMSRRLLGS